MTHSKKFFIKVSLCLLPLCLLANFITSANILDDSIPSISSPFIDDEFIIVDTDVKTELPNRFRDIEKLNISGSAQFNPIQLDNLKEKIGTDNITIVDLRQESHGFINDTPISFYSLFKLINCGLSTKDTLKSEKKALSSIKEDNPINLYDKDAYLKETINANKILSEHNSVKNANLNYHRFAVKDGGIPTPTVVDDFVSFVVNLDPEIHLHFDCHEGLGRTTTFMSLYQMIKNTDKLSLEEILNEQVSAGGEVLTKSKSRSKFLEHFYNYTLENIDTHFKTPYSTWISQSNIKN